MWTSNLKDFSIYPAPRDTLRDPAVLHSCCTSLMSICSYWNILGFIGYFSGCSLGVIHTFNSAQFPNLFTSLTYWEDDLDSPPIQRKVVVLLLQRCSRAVLLPASTWPTTISLLYVNSFSSLCKNVKAEISVTPLIYIRSDEFFYVNLKIIKYTWYNMKMR